MKHLAKRTLSLLLAALMVLSLIPASTHVHAAVTNVSFGYTGVASDPRGSGLTATSNLTKIGVSGTTFYGVYALKTNLGFSLTDKAAFLDANYNGNVNVTVEYLSDSSVVYGSQTLTFTQDYILEYPTTDGTWKTATPVSVVDSTLSSDQGTVLPAKVATYRLYDVTLDGTRSGVNNLALTITKTGSASYFPLRSVKISKRVPEVVFDSYTNYLYDDEALTDFTIDHLGENDAPIYVRATITKDEQATDINDTLVVGHPTNGPATLPGSKTDFVIGAANQFKTLLADTAKYAVLFKVYYNGTSGGNMAAKTYNISHVATFEHELDLNNDGDLVYKLKKDATNGAHAPTVFNVIVSNGVTTWNKLFTTGVVYGTEEWTELNLSDLAVITERDQGTYTVTVDAYDNATNQTLRATDVYENYVVAVTEPDPEPGCEHTGGEATCTAQAICATCGQPYGELNPENHEGGEATCKDLAVCDLCGQPYGELDLTKHNYSAATCTAKAKCTVCGDEKGDVDPNNHKMVVTESAVEATCGEAGKTAVYTCANNCGHQTGGDPISATGEHDYDNKYDTTCNVCGFVRNIHAGTNTTLGNSIDMNINLGLDKKKVENGQYTPKVSIDGVEVDGVFTLTENGTNTYFVKVPGLAAKDLNKVVTVTIYEGEELVMEATDSFADYVERLINSTDPKVTDKHRTLATKMALYATAAQNYFPGTSGESVIEQLDKNNVNYSEFTGKLETFKHMRVEDDAQDRYMGSNFDLEENITMNMYVRDVDYAVIEYTPYNSTQKVEMTIQAATCETSGSYYKFKMEGFVTADGAQTVVTAKFYKNGEAEPVVTVTDSMAAYVARNTGDSLYDAMLQYATAAYNALP